MKKVTLHIDIGLILVVVILSLHCYALHKRVAYLQGQCEREYSRGIVETAQAFANGTARVLTNNLQSAFDKEVAP